MNRDETGQISDENLERRVAAGCPAWGYRKHGVAYLCDGCLQGIRGSSSALGMVLLGRNCGNMFSYPVSTSPWNCIVSGIQEAIRPCFPISARTEFLIPENVTRNTCCCPFSRSILVSLLAFEVMAKLWNQPCRFNVRL